MAVVAGVVSAVAILILDAVAVGLVVVVWPQNPGLLFFVGFLFVFFIFVRFFLFFFLLFV